MAVQDIPLIQYLRTVETDRITTALERDSFVIAGRAEETLETPTPEGLNYVQEAITKYGAFEGREATAPEADVEDTLRECIRRILNEWKLNIED